MKRFFKALIIIIIFTGIIVLFKKNCFKQYKITTRDNKIGAYLKYKGLKNARDFAVDEKDNYYIAYKDKIQLIYRNGKSLELLDDKNYNINSIEYYNNKLYFSSKTSVYSYDISNEKIIEIIKNLPNFGDYKESIIKRNGEYLYVTIGAATNSGVVGEDNLWISNNSFAHDISPYKITLKGINYSNGKTGAFSAYGTKTVGGQIVPGHFPGNASIIMYNLNNKAISTFAWGIRNVKGIDFDSRGRIIASIGGMENRGLRSITGDTDYIYVIKDKTWYGWPDYSGGDPVNSPRFKDGKNKTISSILENHPTTSPSAPLYTHKKLNVLKSLVVDKKGIFGEKDSIYFCDSKDKKMYSINSKGILKEEINFYKNSEISSIKYIKNQIIILDSNEGNIYIIQNKKNM